MIEPLLPYVLAERLHRVQIRTDRCFRIGAAHEFLAHPLQKYGHRELLSLPPTLLVHSSDTLFRPPRQRLRSSRVAFRNSLVQRWSSPPGTGKSEVALLPSLSGPSYVWPY